MFDSPWHSRERQRNAVKEDEALAPSQRRLQRPPDFTGDRLRTFRAVALRHGVPGAVLGLLLLVHPDARALLVPALGAVLADPGRYLAIAAIVLVVLIVYTALLDRRIDAASTAWILYLLLVSIWEEWVFRIAIPYSLQANGVDLRTAIVASNALFAVAHYFTLRWKWHWCLAAGIAGLALSRSFAQHGDLALLIGIHWIATFLNTPRAPGRSRLRDRDGWW
jgi:hypothetical protein